MNRAKHSLTLVALRYAWMWLLLVGVWLLTALSFGYHTLVDASLRESFIIALVDAASWVGTGLLSYGIALRWPLLRENLTPRFGRMVALATILVALRMLLPNLHRLNEWSMLAFVFALFPANVTLTLALLYAGAALAFYFRQRERQLAAAQLEQQLAEAQLRTLAAQVTPHFLFNALNSITALVRAEPATASRMMQRLDGLLRHSLQFSEEQEISLGEELRFVDDYISLEQMRLLERLQVTRAIDPSASHVKVPVLLLQPLVENAIRHGIAPRLRPGHLHIEALRSTKGLQLRVLDDGLGLAENWRSGIGLGTTQKRLHRLYPGRHNFTIRRLPGGGTEVNIEIHDAQTVDFAVARSA